MAEYFDIVDSEGRPTGKIKLRKLVHADGDWHRAVEVWIVNGKNAILIQRRARSKDAFPGKWDASCAGHISAGEESLATALRELQEELGIEVSENDLKYLFRISEKHITNRGTFVDNEIKDIYFLRMDVEIGDLKLQEEEVMDARFIHFLKLRKLLKKQSWKFVPHAKTYHRLFQFLQKFQD